MAQHIAEGVTWSGETAVRALRAAWRDLRHHAPFLLAVPLALGFIGGWGLPGRTTGWSTPVAIAYFSTVNLGMWLGAYLVCATAGPVARALSIPYWLHLAIGFALGSPLGVAFAIVFLVGLGVAAPDHPGLRPLPEFGARPSTLVLALPLWVLAHYILKWPGPPPRYGYDRDDAAANGDASAAGRSDAGATARLAARLVVPSLDAVVALRAEQNYVRVYANGTERLVLGRLGEFAEVLGERGAQVHRSWWVNRSAVADTAMDGDPNHVTLKTGMDVPIGRTYKREALRRLRPGAA